jgi:ABC-type multidrug transport system permease subunit
MGVYPVEVILGHTLCQILILAGQILLMLLIALLAFSLPMAGSLGLVVLLMGLLGLAGMLYGLFISTVAPEEAHAMQMALGSFFPVLLLSGVIWPLEAIPTGLNYISLALPTTWAAEAMRSLMLRGWDIHHQAVWGGYLVVLAWVALFLFAGVRGIRRVD